MSGDLLYLRHILDAIEKVESYTAQGRQTFMTHSYWQDAVIRQPEIIVRPRRTCLLSFEIGIRRFHGGVSVGCGTF